MSARAPRRVAVLFGLVWVCLLWVAAGALAAPVFTPVSGSPFATGMFPASVAFSPSGALTAVSGSPFATGTAPVSVAFSSSGGCSRPPITKTIRCRCSR
jgi:hypothetical protein